MENKTIFRYLLFYYLDMKEIIDYAKQDGNFGTYWDEFWVVSSKLGHYIQIDWYDPDTTEEENMMARFNAVKQYIEREVL